MISFQKTNTLYAKQYNKLLYIIIFQMILNAILIFTIVCIAISQ